MERVFIGRWGMSRRIERVAYRAADARAFVGRQGGAQLARLRVNRARPIHLLALDGSVVTGIAQTAEIERDQRACSGDVRIRRALGEEITVDPERPVGRELRRE